MKTRKSDGAKLKVQRNTLHTLLRYLGGSFQLRCANCGRVKGFSGMADRAGFVVQKLFSLYADRQGATAIEYGLIIGIISMAIVFGLEGVRDGLLSVFEILATTFANAMA